MPSHLSEKEARALIQVHVNAALEALSEAEAIANKAGVYFSFKPAYGMGGVYYSPKFAEKENEQSTYKMESGWLASSHSC